MIKKIFALMIKEFITILTDKKSRMVLIMPPVAQLIVFGYAASFDLNHIPFAVYNEDPGPASRALISRFEGSRTFELYGMLDSDDQVAPVINLQKALMVIHLGPKFSENIRLRQPADIQVILDGRNSNTALIALNYVHSIVLDFNQDFAGGIGKGVPPARLVVRSWFNRTLNSHWFIIPGIVALLTLVVTIEITALSIAKEREGGTFDQLLITPMTPFQILVGKSLPGFIIGVLEASFIVFMTVVWFDIPLRGSILALYAGILAFLLAAIGIGLMISAISVTQQQGLMGAFLFLVPAVILSGFATPIENMPEFIQYITYINPMRYLLIIVRSVFLEGASFSLLWQQYVPMLLIGVTTLATAGIMFRKRMY